MTDLLDAVDELTRPILSRYKTTKTEGSAHRNHTPGVYQDVTERNENGKES